jgi:hypothetical protein
MPFNMNVRDIENDAWNGPYKCCVRGCPIFIESGEMCSACREGWSPFILREREAHARSSGKVS